jgi:hypothetical protein
MNRDTKTAKTATQVAAWLNFSPLTLSPALWLDAADLTTITESGGRVSQWDDKSGNGRHLTQSNATFQPVTGATTINGQNVIDFTSLRRLSRSSDNIFRNIGGGAIFAVVRGTYSGVFSTFMVITTNNENAIARAFLGSNSGAILAGGRRLDGTSFQSVLAASIPNDILTVSAGLFDYAGAALVVSVNNVQTPRSGGFQTAGNTSNTASQIHVGSDPGANSFTGSSAEYIVLSQLPTQSQIISTELYLRSKWSVY